MDEVLFQYSKSRIWLLSIHATVGFFLFGFNLGVTAFSHKGLDFLNESLPGDYFYLFNEFFQLGTVFGALSSAFMADTYGRRRSIMVYDLLIVLACVCAAVPWAGFPVSRFLCGLAIGGMSCVVLHYMREISPVDLFGSLGPLIQLQIVSGILFAYVLALIHRDDTVVLWLFIYSAQGIIALGQWSIFKFKYTFDTPYYLWVHNKEAELKAAVKYIYPHLHQSLLYTQLDITNSFRKIMIGDACYALGRTETFGSLLRCKKPGSWALRMGCLLNFFQQATAINPVLFRLNEILSKHLEPVNLQFSFCASAVINLFPVLFTFYLNNHFGRKPLMMLSGVCVAFCLTLGAIFQNSDVVVTVFFVGVVVFFEIGLGPFCWIVSAEILTVRSASLCISVNWLTHLIYLLLYHSCVQNSSFEVPFYLLSAVISLASAIYIYFDVLETQYLNHFEIFNLIYNN